MGKKLKEFKRMISVVIAGAFILESVNIQPLCETNAKEPDSVTEQVRHKNISVKEVDAGTGVFSKVFDMSVPRRSSGSHSDTVKWSMGRMKSTGAGRARSANASADLSSNGNSARLTMTGLLDNEEYTVKVSYQQKYYWDETRSYTYTDQDQKKHTAYRTITRSATKRGSFTQTYTTPDDRYIRDAADLSEKVHKYGSLSLANDIDLGTRQCIADGLGRHKWLSEDGISAVQISGNGRTVTRGGSGAAFQVINGAALSLRDIYVHAYSGDIERIPTDGDEYITENASDGAGGVGIVIGSDRVYDASSDTKGTLQMKNSEVCAGRSAVVFRYGSADISSSMMYGMGAKDFYKAPGGSEYYGTGLGLINSSGNLDAEVSVKKDSSIYGRFNGVFVQGTADVNVDDCFIRSDCEDAFDFRGSGDLDISNCSVSGVKGIDIFHDATMQGIKEATNISTATFNGSVFRQKVLPDRKDYQKRSAGTKGTVTVRDTTMNLITGPFKDMAGTIGAGIQNHGDISVGKNVKINVRHSKAWYTMPAGNRAEAIGIWNSKRLELPADISVDADGTGIKCTRDIESLRTAMKFYYDMESDKAKDMESRAAADESIFDYLDDGLLLSLSLKGGTVTGRETGINCLYGNLYIEPSRKLVIAGDESGIEVGRNDEDNIYGDDAMNVNFLIDGIKQTDISSSLHGTGIVVRKSAHGSIFSTVDISGQYGRCGTGIRNYGTTEIRNAVINAEEMGIRNCEDGTIYMGDDLEEDEDLIRIKGAIYGIYNSGRLIYYRNVDIRDSEKAAVYQDGEFYMLPGSEVRPDENGKNVIFLDTDRTVRLMYEESERNLIEKTRGTFLTGPSDRKPGRVMVELYSPWGAGGGVDYSQEKYKDMSASEKTDLTELMTGFDLAFDKVMDHPAALRSGLGKYKKRDTNGRSGTLILSCALKAVYEADLPVKNDHISSSNPKATPYYWMEPTKFTVASDVYDTDRSRILYDGRDVTAGLRQLGWRDRNKKGKYGDRVYSDRRITEIYGDDHLFSGVWDTGFTLLFDGNGQTNGADNYQESNVAMGYTFSGNTGPEKNEPDYFRKSVKKNDSLHPVAFDGWSLDDKAVYKDKGIYRDGDTIGDTIGFYVKALERENVTLNDDEAVVRVFAVWDEYPVITAYDSYFYADDLTDANEVQKKLLDPEKVFVTDLCDGDIPQEKIQVYTDLTMDIFDIEAMKGLGDAGSINVYYRASDENGHESVATAKVYVMTEESEDTSDDIPSGSARGKSGTSSDTMYSSPVYVRNIDKDNRQSLIAKSVWHEESYVKALNQAFTGSVEKWKFTDKDIESTKAMLYNGNMSPQEWRNAFSARRVDSRVNEADKSNKPMIIEEGLSSFRIIWDLKSEMDRIDLTLTPADGSKVQKYSVDRQTGKKISSSIIIDSLKPGVRYDVAADLYDKNGYVTTLSQTAQTASLEVPQTKMSCRDLGKRVKVKIAIRTDSLADSYVVERRKAGTDEWKELKTIQNNGDAMLSYYGSISEEGVFLYRIKSRGHQIGSTEMTEESDYTAPMETAFVRQPVIENMQSGCRSLSVTFRDDSQADFIRVFYQDGKGLIMHTDYHDDKKSIVISDGRLTDGTGYKVNARAYITSPESGHIYTGLVSEKESQRTFALKAPRIQKKQQQDIYSAKGNTISYMTDKHADGYRISIKKLYPDEGDLETLDIDGSGTYLHDPKETGIYSYVVKADFTTLDGKKFHIDSDEITAAYILPQSGISGKVSEGKAESIGFAKDSHADGYLLMMQQPDGTQKKVYVPKAKTKAVVRASGGDWILQERRAVLFYNGTEYRGECI